MAGPAPAPAPDPLGELEAQLPATPPGQAPADPLSSLEAAAATPASLAKHLYGLDLSDPTDLEGARAQIAKLPAGQRADALQKWADVIVAHEHAPVDGVNPPGRDIADVARTIGRGVGLLGPWAARINAATSAIPHALGELVGADVGTPYDENLAYQQAQDRYVDENAPIASTIGQLAGGLGGGVAGTLISGAKTLGAKVASTALAGPMAAEPGASTVAERLWDAGKNGAIFGANAGVAGSDLSPAGALEGAARGGALGLVGGVALQPAIEGATGALQRIGAVPQILADPEHAGNLILNRTFEDAGLTPDEAQAEYDAQQANARYGSNSSSAVPMNWADILGDAGMRRARGAAAVPGPGSAEAADVLNARQVGTRAPYSGPIPTDQPIAAQQAVMGQRDRVIDNLARALQIKDSKTAYQTDEALNAALEKSAEPDYALARQQAQPFATPLKATLDRWQAEADDLGPHTETAQLISKMIAKFQKDPENGIVRGQPNAAGGTDDLKGFDAAKRELDDMWSTFGKSATPQPAKARLVTMFTHDVLDAVHGGDRNAPTLNQHYATARTKYAGTAKVLDALEFGRNALQENAEALPEHIANLDKEQLKAARMGALETMKKRTAGKPGDDATQIFRQRRVEDALTAFMPPDTAAFSPGRQFGQAIENERAMNGNRNSILFGSRTAPLQEDLQDLTGWSKYAATLAKTGWEPAMFQALGDIVQHTIGYRPATAAVVAHGLLSTDPAEMAATLARVRAQHGAGVANQLKFRVQALYNRLAAGAIGTQIGRFAAPAGNSGNALAIPSNNYNAIPSNSLQRRGNALARTP